MYISITEIYFAKGCQNEYDQYRNQECRESKFYQNISGKKKLSEN